MRSHLQLEVEKGRMLVRVTCAGVVVGTADFESPHGVAHAAVRTTAGYACASDAAARLGRQFARTQFWMPRDGDFAATAASRWEGDRLALEDETGRELSVNSVVLLAGLPGDGTTTVRVVADFRPDVARATAAFRPQGVAGGRRTRPAA